MLGQVDAFAAEPLHLFPSGSDVEVKLVRAAVLAGGVILLARASRPPGMREAIDGKQMVAHLLCSGRRRTHAQILA